MLCLLPGSTGDAGVSLEPAWPEPDNLVRTADSCASSNGKADCEPSNKLPGFIKPLATCVDRDDIAYLQSKGALLAPDLQLQNALLWSFFEYVYPFLPVVDIEEFLGSVHDRQGTSGQVSLLLYQAVLFAGTAHVNMDHLKGAGFSTRREARKAFFHRVRVSFIPQRLVKLSLTLESASLRLQHRARPSRHHPGPPSHDTLVRDPQRAQKHLALDRCCHFTSSRCGAASRSAVSQLSPCSETPSTIMVGVSYA